MNDIEKQEFLDQVQKRIELHDRIVALAERYELAKRKSKGFLGLKEKNILDKPILNGDQEFYDLIRDYSIEDLKMAENVFQLELDELMNAASGIGFLEGVTYVAVSYSIVTINDKYFSLIGLFILIATFLIRLYQVNSRFKQRSIAIQAKFICGMAGTWK